MRHNILLIPGIPVFWRCEEVSLAAIAVGMCQHEVVTQIERITAPRDEVIHLASPLYRLAAVKADSPLQLSQYFPNLSQPLPA